MWRRAPTARGCRRNSVIQRSKWFNTAAFVNPPNYTYGNLGRALPDVMGPGIFNIDMSLIKNIHLWKEFHCRSAPSGSTRPTT